MATLRNICPYDMHSCVQYLDRLLLIEKMLANARKYHSSEVFFYGPGSDIPDGCPLPDSQKATCVRYQIWKKNHPNESR